MIVTQHFRSEEFACHGRHFKDGIVIPAEPYPAAWINERLRPLCEVLEAVRKEIGAPIIINSGYRSPTYQAELYKRSRKDGSVAKDSQHSHGRAADVCAPHVSAEEIHAAALELWNAGALPELGGLGVYVSSNFVHLDVRPHPPGQLARWRYA